MSNKPKIPTALEKAILKAIKASGMTQRQLGAKGGIDQPTLSRFLSKDLQVRRTITLPVADRICKVLGLKLVSSAKQKRKGKTNA